MKELQLFAEAIDQCVRCGACQAHCPVYDQERSEGTVARGKLALAKALLNGQVQIEQRLAEDLSLCLMCGSCVLKCPNKVPTDQIVGAMRRLITADQGLTPSARAVSALTGSPRLLNRLVKTVDLLSPALFRKVPSSSGLRLRFPLPGQHNRTLPATASQSLFARFPEYTQGQADRPVVGIFAGCATSYLFPAIGAAMITLLTRLGFSLFFPHDQGCCGIPARSAGNGRLIDQLSSANLRAFSRRPVDYIVTACASCNAGLRQLSVPDGPPPFADKVLDIHQLLCQEGIDRQLAALPRGRQAVTVSYHDPCHLRTRGISEEPRRLLQALPDCDFVEMSGADRCCGLGGTFSMHHYGCSQAIGRRKLPGLTASNAALLATACPGCMIQLQDTINHAGLPVRTVHSLELIIQALDGQRP
ncbi:(Fe-S)-binding protein [Desulfogranum mediterraneum]|uniref:(Fe-S)-binding protein n=1 Tax=Desulfogranum mediterraneum TaxID=160661 RepID=UPI0004243F14|nr:(Fe-S)-binding protein [Desulfogranum mediterraneum]